MDNEMLFLFLARVHIAGFTILLLFPVWFPFFILLLSGGRKIRKKYYRKSYDSFEMQHQITWRLLKVLAIGCAIFAVLVIVVIYEGVINYRP